MNDETRIDGEDAAAEDSAAPKPDGRRVPEPVEKAGFALQERVVWPLQDRFSHLGPGPNRKLLVEGAAALVVAAVVAVLALSGGGGPSTPATTVSETSAPQREPLVATAPDTATPEKEQPPAETLHGAKPVFSPPSTAIKGGEKTGDSDGSNNNGDPAEEASAAPSSHSSSPAAATISSDPATKPSTESGGADSTATAARATVPTGPPAGPAALKVARKFAQGFVVYETGGQAAAFEKAFAASATPQLSKALLERPPKQPAGVRVPRAKVLNVVAGPSQGRVYKVSVSLLRVGVTSELRLDMEKTESGKRVEWRITNVLG